MTEFDAILKQALLEGACLSLVLSRKRKDARSAADKLTVRPVTLRGENRFQLASRIGRQESHENVSPAEAVSRVCQLLGDSFLDCHLFTTDADYTVHTKPDGSLKVRRSPATKQAASAQHNRTKSYLIPEGEPCPFLIEIGVMTTAGKVKASRYDKFRQINRFLELVNDAVDDLPRDRMLEVVDFGCGKSYLTFALHHLLTEIQGRNVNIVGLDQNAKIVEDCERIGERLACRGLSFCQSEIDAYHRAAPVDLAVSLHACDTATDDALAKAVSWQAAVILAVPCCQHEIAPQLSAGALSALTDYGILRERFAALATDALRARALELSGYRTQVLEFIDMEHTAKNLLIRATRRQQPAASPESLRESYRAFKQLLGVKQFRLEELLDGIGTRE